MWGCSQLSNFSAMGGTLALALAAGLGVAALVLLVVRRSRGASSGKDVHRDRADSLEILRIRYARGEVDKAEYLRMKKMLKQSRK